MKRTRTRQLIVAVTTFFLLTALCVPTLAQQRRLPTGYGQDAGPAPSFRGGKKAPADDFQYQYDMGTGTGRGMGDGEGDESRGMALGYQVHVLGEVRRPGTYRIPPSGRLADAVQMAGGLAINGSSRKIELKRKGRRIQLVDLQKFKLFGSLGDNPYLLDNDVVFVPLQKDVIQIAGAIRRPETYELRNEKNLQQVIDLAGGFNAAAALDEPIRVIRFVDGKKQVREVRIDKIDMKNFAIQGGDVIVIPNVVTKETEFDYNVASIPGDQVFYPSYEDRVFVLGGVRAPGAYPFSPYYTVNQYISLAGGITQSGKDRYKIITASGKERKASENDRVNPGDTIKIKERWMTPAGWLGFALGIASFGLSASATIIAISK